MTPLRGHIWEGLMQAKRASFTWLVLFTCLGVSAAFAQTDVALSVYGAFNTSTTVNLTTQTPSNAAGGMLEFRHITSPCLLYTSPSPRDPKTSRMPSSA